MTRKQLIERIASRLTTLYGEKEALSIARLVAEKRFGISRMETALDPKAPVKGTGEEIKQIVAELASGRPVQYVLGEADFCDMRFEVGEGALIPRPETEELTEWILRESRPYEELLDIGTGSGCIAITLSLRMPRSRVTAIDISQQALTWAIRNNFAHDTDVRFIQADILDPELDLGRFDVIVSNPPYIPTAERSKMQINVTRYEPEEALFVPDDDPLLYYRAIGNFALRSLKPNGRLYFEINETLANETVALLRKMGFSDVQLRQDINEKPRMLRCRR